MYRITPSRCNEISRREHVHMHGVLEVLTPCVSLCSLLRSLCHPRICTYTVQMSYSDLSTDTPARDQRVHPSIPPVAYQCNPTRASPPEADDLHQQANQAHLYEDYDGNPLERRPMMTSPNVLIQHVNSPSRKCSLNICEGRVDPCSHPTQKSWWRMSSP